MVYAAGPSGPSRLLDGRLCPRLVVSVPIHAATHEKPLSGSRYVLPTSDAPIISSTPGGNRHQNHAIRALTHRTTAA